MIKILIIEGDTPEQLELSARQGQLSNAQYYRDAIHSCRNDVQTEVAQPYTTDFSLQKLNLKQVDGVIFTGSTVNWSVDAAEAKPLRQAMEKAFHNGKPVLGSCNGLQLGAVVLGGKVAASPNGLELGLARDIRLTTDGESHPLHKGRPAVYASPCIHRDEISELPPGAVLTATNAHSPVQAMVYEQAGICFWGMQYHPEISASQIATIVTGDGLFSADRKLADELCEAEADPLGKAAVGLGIRGTDLQPQTRMLELSNWLAMVAKKTAKKDH